MEGKGDKESLLGPIFVVSVANKKGIMVSIICPLFAELTVPLPATFFVVSQMVWGDRDRTLVASGRE